MVGILALGWISVCDGISIGFSALRWTESGGASSATKTLPNLPACV